jgi:hypothetical protein
MALTFWNLVSPEKAGAARKQERRPAGIERVVVVCIQRDGKSNRRIETLLAPRLRRQGLDPLTSETAFKGIRQYSPFALMERMRQSRVDGIMLAEFSGQPAADEAPRAVRYKFYALKALPKNPSKRRMTLDEALTVLLKGERP